MSAKFVWVFNGAGGRFPSGVFEDKTAAIGWISQNRLSGVLTQYPVNMGVYDWAVNLGIFNPRKENQKTPEFIGSFTTASQEHFHFEDGIQE